ncbi:hypothetical protein PL263_10675 [Methylomonas sp. EFPC3]|uniref:DUF1302 family protein n=1 Tax=Methylomonas sp. EFPC3 TaxID=3021710 RepID=UPI002415F375|nr:DUF1302 family protein [Methylomonas sp. EFPC3]WFP48577.1 hypothetical protein PL263_10675 [Methylomonas sp. EFPC3]
MPSAQTIGRNLALRWLALALALTTAARAEPTLDLPDTGSLAFDDNAVLAAADAGSEFWDKFTFKFTQLVYAQVHTHKTDSGALKQATVEDNRLGLLIKYQNPFAPGWNLQGSGQAKLYWPSDYDFEGLSSQSIEMEQRLDNLEMRLNELYLSKTFGSHTFKLGRQTLVWGEAEGNSVLDTLNVLEYRDLSTIEVEDARINQWFAVWEHFADARRWAMFVNLNPQFNPLPRKGSPAYVAPLFPIDAPESDRHRVEAGARMQWSVEHSDVSLMAAYLYENQLHYLTPVRLSGHIQAKDNGYWLLGASANRAIGKLLLKLDLAYSVGLLEDTTILAPIPHTSTVRKDQIGASFGFDYALTNDQSINASVLARSFLAHDSGLAPGERTANGDIFGTWLIRYNCRFLNDTLNFTSFNQGTLNAGQALSSAMLTYAIDDHWSVMGTVIATFANKRSALPILDQDVRVGFSISFSL